MREHFDGSVALNSPTPIKNQTVVSPFGKSRRDDTNVAHSGSCGDAWSETAEPRRGGTRGEISVPPRRGLPLAPVGYSGLHGTGFTRCGKRHLGASGVKTPDESNALTSWLKPRPTNLPTFSAACLKPVLLTTEALARLLGNLANCREGFDSIGDGGH